MQKYYGNCKNIENSVYVCPNDIYELIQNNLRMSAEDIAMLTQALVPKGPYQIPIGNIDEIKEVICLSKILNRAENREFDMHMQYF